MTIPESFKGISQVKKRLLTADCKKNYNKKKRIFLKKGTKIEIIPLKWYKHLMEQMFKNIQDIH